MPARVRVFVFLAGRGDDGARPYDPALGRFVQPDSDVPESQDGKGLDRYAYVANNPVVFDDPSGHCWGAASALRGVPSYSTTCNNVNAALSIVTSVKTTFTQRLGASAYVVTEAAAHVGLVVGAAILGGEAVAGALCADNNCGNEIDATKQAANSVSNYVESDLPEVEQFVRTAIDTNYARGFGSLGATWNAIVRGVNASQIFINRAGGRISGMMQVGAYRGGGYEIKFLEGLGNGAGTNLFRQAIADSMAKGYGGSIYLMPTDKALEWYLTRFPGATVLENGYLYWSSEAAQAILNSR